MSRQFSSKAALAEKIASGELVLDHRQAETYLTFGLGLQALQRDDAAIKQFEKAISLEPDYAEAYNHLARSLRTVGQTEEAISCFGTALSLRPDDVEALFNLGNTYLRQGRLQEALPCYQKAASLDPDDAFLHLKALSALIDAEVTTPKWDKWPEYGRWLLTEVYNLRVFSRPRWDGTPLRGKTLLVYAEQGLGDDLQMVRYLPQVKAQAQGRIILECPKPLLPLFRMVGGVDEVVPRHKDLHEPVVPYDVRIDLMTLPLLFLTEEETIPSDVPYLHADAERTERWREWLSKDKSFQDKNLKVGLRWAGSKSLAAHGRSCSLADFAPLAEVRGVSFYSLQTDAAAAQVTAPPAGLMITDLAEHLTSFDETAAVIANLDLVISVDTSVLHLAGALARPTWGILPWWPAMRWRLKSRATPWYPTMRLFRQKASGNWQSVFEQVAEELTRTEMTRTEMKLGEMKLGELEQV